MSDLEPRPGLVPLTLVPVEVFTGMCDHAGCDQPDHLGYGISDAVSAWSDCNRAIGRIYRVEDIDSDREPGDSVTVWVAEGDVEWFKRQFGEEFA